MKTNEKNQNNNVKKEAEELSEAELDQTSGGLVLNLKLKTTLTTKTLEGGGGLGINSFEGGGGIQFDPSGGLGFEGGGGI